MQPSTSPILAYTTPSGTPAHWTDVTIHTLNPRLLVRYLLRTSARAALIGIAVVIISLAIPVLILKLPLQNMRMIWMLSLCGLVPGLVASVITVRRMWRKTELVIGNEGLLQRGNVLPTMEISRQDILRFDLGKRALVVRTARRFKTIAILHEYEGVADIRDRLLTWTEIPASPPTWRRTLQRIAPPLAAGMVAMTAIFLTFHTRSLLENSIGIGLFMIVDISVTLILVRAPELPVMQRIMTILAIWLGMPPMVLSVLMRHWLR